jgi:hypothetical protein
MGWMEKVPACNAMVTCPWHAADYVNSTLSRCSMAFPACHCFSSCAGRETRLAMHSAAPSLTPGDSLPPCSLRMLPLQQPGSSFPLQAAQQLPLQREWPTGTRVSCSQLHGPHMVLVGDAAHAISPRSGNGLNSAMEDARRLDKVCVLLLHLLDIVFSFVPCFPFCFPSWTDAHPLGKVGIVPPHTHRKTKTYSQAGDSWQPSWQVWWRHAVRLD